MGLFLLAVRYLLVTSATFNLENIPSFGSPPPGRVFHFTTYISKLNSVAVFGGNTSVRQSYNDLWLYNLDKKIWKQLISISTNIPRERINFGGFYDKYHNEMYIFGGNSQYGPKNDMWKFNFDLLEWKEVLSFNTPGPIYRFAYTSFEMNSTIFFAIFGGKVFSGNSNNLYLYNLNTNTWTLMPYQGDVPGKGYLNSISYYNNFIFLATGLFDDYPADATYNPTFTYSLSTKTWKKLALQTDYLSRSYTACLTIDNYIYILYGCDNINYIDYNNSQRLDANKLTGWETIQMAQNDSEIYRDSYAATTDGKNIYLTLGFIGASATTLNDLVVIYPNKTFDFLSKTLDVPTARMYHSMVVINGLFYLFGGYTGSGQYSNELWIFSPEDETWQTIQAQGTAPTARYMHGADSFGDIMVIWGGEGENGKLNDMHYYNALTNVWNKVSASNQGPSERKGVCLSVAFPYVLIFAGEAVEGLTNELWIYYIGNNSYELLQVQNLDLVSPGMLRFCDSNVTEDGNVLFYSYTGVGNVDQPLLDIMYFNLANKNWTFLYEGSSTDNLNITSPIAVKLEDSYLVIGGETWSTDAWKDVFVVYNEKGVYQKYEEVNHKISHYIWASAFVYYKNFIYSHGGGDTMGGSTRPLIPHGNMYKFNVSSFCQVLKGYCNAICSPGTFYNPDTYECVICPKGTYSSIKSNSDCLKCSAGTYNRNEGASSIAQCYPCPEGFFNNDTGKSLCLSCPPGYNCPSGSELPSFIEYETQIYQVQPPPFSKNSAEAQAANNIFYYTFMSFCIVAILSVIFLRKILFPLIVKVDIYTDRHCYTMNSHLILQKTLIGGICSVVFGLVAVLLIISTIITFSYENITEKKSLIPLVINNQQSTFKSDFEIDFTLLRYGGSCNSNGTQTCVPEISFTQENIIGNFVQESCVLADRDCTIVYTCKSCVLNPGASLKILAAERASYASAISINITSDSSIEDYKSLVYILLKSDTNTIFRGSDATNFYISAIPSLFTQEIENINQTGYHLSVSTQPERGSVYSNEDIAFTSNLLIAAYLEITDSSLITDRYQTQSEIIMINLLLGSVFGLLSGFSVLMRAAEVLGLFLKNLADKIKRQNAVLKKRIALADQLSRDPELERVKTMYDSLFMTEPLDTTRKINS